MRFFTHQRGWIILKDEVFIQKGNLKLPKSMHTEHRGIGVRAHQIYGGF